MKKILSLVAGAVMVLSAQANTRVLYSQTFEGVTDAEKVGWTKHDKDTGLSIGSDEEGSFLSVTTTGNDRAAYLFWGDAIYTDKEGQSFVTDGEYKVTFDFNYQTGANNHYNTSMTVFSGAYTLDKNNHQSWGFIGESDNWLFDMTQTDADNNFICDKDTANKAMISIGEWYTAEVTVNINDRTATYDVYPATSSTSTFTGTYAIPDTVEIMATGFNILMGRYSSVMLIDNLQVSCESDVDVANDPVIALSRIGTVYNEATDSYVASLNTRAYTITFAEGHTLTVKGTDGQTETVDYLDCEGKYEYETSTSGTLEAFTTYGTANSELVTMAVDCTPCKLPKAEAVISNVKAGFAKEYTLQVSNADVPLQPTIYLEYIFTAKDGTVTTEKNLTTGAKLQAPGEGELVVKTSALGYEGNEMSVLNSIEYIVKKVHDFARMTPDEITALGFAKIDDLNSSTTSGESNWTARKRLFYYDIATKTTNEAGEDVYTAVYPFGYVEGDDNACIHRYHLSIDDLLAGKDSTTFPGVVLWNPNFNSKESSAPSPVQWDEHLGILSNSTANNNRPVTFLDLKATDFLVVNTINDYGSNSNHPIVATAAEYYEVLEGANTVVAGTEAVPAGEAVDYNATYSYAFQLYRIDTVLTKATIFGLADEEGVASVAVDQNNEDPYYYTIDGLRLLQPTKAGLYIHGGKKVYITK